jgi:hypothetical protein
MVSVKVVSHVNKKRSLPHTLLAPHVFEYTLSVGNRVELFRFAQTRNNSKPITTTSFFLWIPCGNAISSILKGGKFLAKDSPFQKWATRFRPFSRHCAIVTRLIQLSRVPQQGPAYPFLFFYFLWDIPSRVIF